MAREYPLVLRLHSIWEKMVYKLKHIGFTLLSCMIAHAEIHLSASAGITGHSTGIKAHTVRSSNTKALFNNILQARNLKPTIANFTVLSHKSIYVEDDNTGTPWANETEAFYLIKAGRTTEGADELLKIDYPNLITREDNDPAGHVGVEETTADDLKINLTKATINTNLPPKYTVLKGNETDNNVVLVTDEQAFEIASIQRNFVQTTAPTTFDTTSFTSYESIHVAVEGIYYYDEVFAAVGARAEQVLTSSSSDMSVINYSPTHLFGAYMGIGIEARPGSAVLLNAGIDVLAGSLSASVNTDDISINQASSFSTVTAYELSQPFSFVELGFRHKFINTNMSMQSTVRQTFNSFSMPDEITDFKFDQMSALFSLQYEL